MLHLLIDMPVYAPAVTALRRMNGISLDIVHPPEERARKLPEQQIRNCDVIFCTFLPQNHMEMSKLKMIQISSSGYKQLVGQKVHEREIKACNALGVFDIPIAEWNIAMMINLARDVRGLVRNQEKKVWDRSAQFQHEIRGSVLGIWGYGGIGRETARHAKALGLQVHVLIRDTIKQRENIYCVPGTGDPDGILPDRVFLQHEKQEFLNGLDFLVMAIPHTKDTEGVVGEPELRMLPAHAFLLNPARGPLVKEQALLKALTEGWIAGAALDTHYHYPLPQDHPLWSMPNVILTPHISGSSSSPRFLQRVWDIFLSNVDRVNRRLPLLNELTYAQLQE